MASSAHVACALRTCILGLGISQGDANVFMSMFGTIDAIVSADDHAWESIPMGAREKTILRSFFTSVNTATTTASIDLPLNPLAGRAQNVWNVNVSAPSHSSISKNQPSIRMDTHCPRRRNFQEFMNHPNIEPSAFEYNHHVGSSILGPSTLPLVHNRSRMYGLQANNSRGGSRSETPYYMVPSYDRGVYFP